MPRLSEDQINAWEAAIVGGALPSGLMEMVRGYRREAVLEAMLREWVDAQGPRNTDPWARHWCMQCGGIKRRVKDSCEHTADCLVARTEALLGETE